MHIRFWYVPLLYRQLLRMTLEEELKMKPITNAHHRAELNVIFTGAWMTERMNSILKPFGISEQQYNILRILRGQKGKPINLLSISERMIHKMSNTTRLVEKLRLKGLLQREVCEHNRRMVEIVITKDGLKMIDKVDEVLKHQHQILHDKLTTEEATLLASLLDKFRD